MYYKIFQYFKYFLVHAILIRTQMIIALTEMNYTFFPYYTDLQWGSKVGKFTKIVVSECDTTQHACILKKGTNVSISIDFTLAERVEEITTVVHGKILGAEIPFPLSNANACEDSGLKCPLEKDSTYEYYALLPVLKAYPKVNVEVKWELKDQNKEDIICVLIPAKIQ